MIRTSTGTDVDRLLRQVTARPEQYSQVIVCSPFIDAEMRERLVRLAELTRRAQCGLRIITCPAAAAQLNACLPGHPAAWRSVVRSRGDLHAKVYLALARLRRDSEVIITSANLTNAGVATNIELGVRARPSTDSGRHLLSEARAFLERLTAA